MSSHVLLGKQVDMAFARQFIALRLLDVCRFSETGISWEESQLRVRARHDKGIFACPFSLKDIVAAASFRPAEDALR